MMSPAAETATSRLRDEHQLILQVADAMQALLASAEGPDACHHGKEEDLLFPELEAAGLPRNQGPIAVMLYEHQQGRAFAQQMADALAPARQGDEPALAALQKAARGYIDLIRGHILKEDRILFEMADQAVRGSACERLCGGYGAVCARRFEGHSKEELQALAANIRERAGLA
jgi:hemerythrin-like domain-containing protein